VRGRSVENDPQSTALKQRVGLSSYVCGGEQEAPHEIMTVNGSVRPQIEIAPGERQFWRFVNASADRYVDLQLEGQKFEIVAMDGEPIAHHDPDHRTRVADHVLLPPAGRLEAIVTGPAAGMPQRLISAVWIPGQTAIRIQRWYWPTSFRARQQTQHAKSRKLTQT